MDPDNRIIRGSTVCNIAEDFFIVINALRSGRKKEVQCKIKVIAVMKTCTRLLIGLNNHCIAVANKDL